MLQGITLTCVVGDFSVQEMHGWLSNILPDVPAPVPGVPGLRLHYVNTLIGCHLDWYAGCRVLLLVCFDPAT